MALSNIVDELIEAGKSQPFSKTEKLIVKRLRSDVPHYSWVGFYWIDQGELILGEWDGPEATEHVRISIGDGICGLAARTGKTEIVDDVNENSEYLACFPSTKSEIVVPIRVDGDVIGELDIDSDNAAAFSDEDKRELERLVERIGTELLSV